MKLTETEILATPVEVHVTEGGTFQVFLMGHAEDEDAVALSRSGTLSEAIEKAKPGIRKRKVRVDVPFYRLVGDRFSGQRFELGTAHGFHAGTGNVMVTEHGKPVQFSARGYRSDRLYKGDAPPEVLGEVVQLHSEIAERNKRIKELDGQWEIDLAEAVNAAIEEAQ